MKGSSGASDREAGMYMRLGESQRLASLWADVSRPPADANAARQDFTILDSILLIERSIASGHAKEPLA